MIDAQDWEGCPNKTECIEGNRFGKGCVEDAVQSAMGGKPWHECRCGVDCNGNPPNARQAAENEKLRAALEAVVAMVLEEAAKVAEESVVQECCGNFDGDYGSLLECCGKPNVTPMYPEEIAAAIRSLKDNP